jgi:hypothetical protein
MEFQTFEPGIEITGQAIAATLDGFRLFPAVAAKYLVKFGIGSRGPDGEPLFDRNGWHSQEKWLATFRAISREVEPGAIYNIGVNVPRYASLPSGMHDIDSALASLDVAYHMNHRKRGVLMFDAPSGQMLEGIGHYGYRRASERRIVCACETPFSCEFDHGVVMGLASLFAPQCRVTHGDETCRKNPADRCCTYVVTW